MDYPCVQILGIRFFAGSTSAAVTEITNTGGYTVAPSGTCFVRLERDAAYREAMARADLAIPDSGLMVSLCRTFRGENLKRISGLAYLKRLFREPEFRQRGRAFFILSNNKAKAKLLLFAMVEKLAIDTEDCYVAPLYGQSVEDAQLLIDIENHRPVHVIIGIGSGPQEKLGYFLRENLSYRPAIHCIGAALGFLTGDQVAIPEWADRFYFGWLFRLFAQPRVFIPRLARALALPVLIIKYGENLPPLQSKVESRI